MSGNLRLNGATSGYSELAAPDVAGDQTFTFPATGGTLATQPSNGSVPGYQQGAWIPRLSNTGGSEVTTWGTPSIRQGDWTRVGNMVTINGIIRAQNTNNISTPGVSATIKDLPYAVGDTACFSSVSIGQMFHLNVANDAAVTMYVEPTMDYLYMQIRNQSSIPSDFSPAAFYNSLSGLIFSASYMTDNTDWTPSNGATVDS